jgi:hypothetical protein
VSKVYKTKRLRKALTANTVTTLGMKFRRRAANTIRHALARHAKLTAKVKVVATAPGGTASATRRMKLAR